MKNLTITSEYSPYHTESTDGSNGSSLESKGPESTLTLRRLKLNEFLSASGKGPIMQ